MEPTNNLAERMLRPAVIWRKKSFGSHSLSGCRYVERMLSVIQTLRLRGADVLNYLSAAVQAHRRGLSPPALPPCRNHGVKQMLGEPPYADFAPLLPKLQKAA